MGVASMKKTGISFHVRARAETPKANEEALRVAAARLSARRLRDVLPGRIETRRLVLRAPIRGDVPALVRLADNRDIAHQLARLPSPYTRADAVAFVEIFAQRADERAYAITLKDEFVGIIGFSFSSDRAPELGYWLGEPFWGQGLMTEAAKGLVEVAHGTRLFPKIIASALPANTASLNVLVKTGFKIVGEAINKVDGRPVIELELDQPR